MLAVRFLSIHFPPLRSTPCLLILATLMPCHDVTCLQYLPPILLRKLMLLWRRLFFAALLGALGGRAGTGSRGSSKTPLAAFRIIRREDQHRCGLVQGKTLQCVHSKPQTVGSVGHRAYAACETFRRSVCSAIFFTAFSIICIGRHRMKVIYGPTRETGEFVMSVSEV